MCIKLEKLNYWLAINKIGMLFGINEFKEDFLLRASKPHII